MKSSCMGHDDVMDCVLEIYFFIPQCLVDMLLPNLSNALKPGRLLLLFTKEIIFKVFMNSLCSVLLNEKSKQKNQGF